MTKRNTAFSSLPYEIFQHILSFGVDGELNNASSRDSYIGMVVKFQSLSKKISTMPEMKDYFNTFWWKVFEKNFGINASIANDLEKLRLQMIKQDEMKRKILLASYIKFKVWKRTKYDPITQNTSEELKIVVLGDGGVGKSTITIYYIQNTFVSSYDPTIEDSYRKYAKVDGEPILLDILDTAGPEEFSAMREQYLRFSGAFVIVCASTDESSKSSMRNHIELMIRCKDAELNDMPVVFVMNKMDLLVDANRNETIEHFRKEVNSIISEFSLLNCSILESSAKKGEDIDKIFEELVRRKRIGGVDNLNLLKGCIEEDVLYLEESKKKNKTKKKCSIM